MTHFHYEFGAAHPEPERALIRGIGGNTLAPRGSRVPQIIWRGLFSHPSAANSVYSIFMLALFMLSIVKKARPEF